MVNDDSRRQPLCSFEVLLPLQLMSFATRAAALIDLSSCNARCLMEEEEGKARQAFLCLRHREAMCKDIAQDQTQ